MRNTTSITLLAALALTLAGCPGTSVDGPEDAGDSTTDMAAPTEDTGEDPDDMGDSTVDDMGDSTVEDMGGDAYMAPDDMGSDECEVTHPRIGWTAELSTLQHGVSGTAVVVDDCTVEIRDFYYDGQGPNVRVYGAPDTDFEANGYSMSGVIGRSQPYQGETIEAKLPADKTLDDLDAISIWCVDFAVDFGSGEFSAP